MRIRQRPLRRSYKCPARYLSADPAQARELAGTVEVYDPAMCCPTGLCGPGVDPALLTIARDLRWLDKQGVTVHRFGLAQEPDAFASNSPARMTKEVNR